MASPFVAEIRLFCGNFAPTGWALCSGQLLPISQNTALFSLLGTFYGGDGKSTFALPDFEGRAPMHQGSGAGLSQRFLGESGGSEYITLLTSEMPAHNHFLMAQNSTEATSALPTGHVLNRATTGNPYIPGSPAPSLVTLAPEALTVSGGSLPHNNMQPFMVVTFIIAMQGVFPPRT
jgi:microcystin-dependent protein